jgi:hypothetical protein
MPEKPTKIEGKLTIENMPDRINVINENELSEILIRAHNRGQRPTVVLVQDDGTLRTWALQVGRDANGQERVALVEADRTPRSQLVLWETTTPGPIRWRGEAAAGEAAVSLYGTNVSGNIQAIENEDTGELRVVGLGADEANNLDRIRTDPNRISWTRPHEEYIFVASVEIPNPEGPLWTPGAAATVIYEVDFLVVNNDAGSAAVAVSIGRDIAGAGAALAAPRFWVFNEIVPYPGSLGWRRGFRIAGNDVIRGVAAVANDASIHWKIKRIDVGA